MAAVPKCGFCVMGYLGIGAAFGFRAREMCGATSGSDGVLPWIAFGVGASALVTRALLWRRNSPTDKA